MTPAVYMPALPHERTIAVHHWRACLLLASLVLSLQSPLLADEWDESYEQGKASLERGEWQQAIKSLYTALEIRPEPDRQATTSSLKLIEYLPHFCLGQAYFYSGDYQKALESFQNSLQAEEILKTSHVRVVHRLVMVCEALTTYARQKKEDAAKNVDGSNLIIALRLLREHRFAEAETAIQTSGFGREEAEMLQGWIAREKQILKEKQAEQTLTGQHLELFQNGLDLFLQSRYHEALQQFEQAEKANPAFTNARSWRNRTEAEIQRLSDARMPDTVFTTEQTIIERVIRETTAPVIAFSAPTRSSFSTRSESVLLTGSARDDHGISFIEMVINGQGVIDSAGLPIKLMPAQGDNAARFAFEAEVPLQLGENEVVLTAYDVDSVTHRTIERFSVTRNPPLYKTAGFLAALGSVLSLLIGGIVLSRYIKYRIAIVNKYNPYIAGAPIRNEEMFFGREKMLKRILNTLHNNSLMIHGPRRIGKTSLQHQLKVRLENLQDPDYHFIPVFIDLQGTDEAHFFATLMEEIIETCKPQIQGQAFRFNYSRENYSGRDLSRDLRYLLQALKETTTKKLKLVLLIDEVDELNKYSEKANQRLRSIFMKNFAENLVAVMSGAYIRKKWESEGSPWYNFFEEIEVPPFDNVEAVRLITEPVKGIFEFDDEAVSKIIEYSEGRPYDIQKVCVHVINRIIEQKRRHATLEDVERTIPHLTRSHREGPVAA